MQAPTRAEPNGQERIVAYLMADAAPDDDWLEEMGVSAIDDNGVWKLTARSDRDMDRLQGHLQQSSPRHCRTPP